VSEVGTLLKKTPLNPPAAAPVVAALILQMSFSGIERVSNRHAGDYPSPGA